MYSIRSYTDGDAADIYSVFESAVRVIGSQDYTQQQVRAWIASAPSVQQIHQRCTDGRNTFVSIDKDEKIVAYIDIENNGHIDHLFCAPEVSRSGASQELYKTVEELAITRGIERLFTEASEAAKRFFGRQGFSTLHRRDFNLGTVAMHNFAMEKQLRPSLATS